LRAPTVIGVDEHVTDHVDNIISDEVCLAKFVH
jgi:hypothetical protein